MNILVIAVVVILVVLLGLTGFASLAWALAVGAFIGWLGSLITKTDSEFGLVGNIIAGLVGSAFGRWLFGTVLGIGSANAAGSVSLAGIFWGAVGAAILIFLFNLVAGNRNSVR